MKCNAEKRRERKKKNIKTQISTHQLVMQRLQLNDHRNAEDGGKEEKEKEEEAVDRGGGRKEKKIRRKKRWERE